MTIQFLCDWLVWVKNASRETHQRHIPLLPYNIPKRDKMLRSAPVKSPPPAVFNRENASQANAGHIPGLPVTFGVIICSTVARLTTAPDLLRSCGSPLWLWRSRLQIFSHKPLNYAVIPSPYTLKVITDIEHWTSTLILFNHFSGFFSCSTFDRNLNLFLIGYRPSPISLLHFYFPFILKTDAYNFVH